MCRKSDIGTLLYGIFLNTPDVFTEIFENGSLISVESTGTVERETGFEKGILLLSVVESHV